MMSYEKQTWAKGDVVTSAKLNHMEDGIADGGVMVVNITCIWNGTNTSDKTFSEIVDAFDNGKAVIALITESSPGAPYPTCREAIFDDMSYESGQISAAVYALQKTNDNSKVVAYEHRVTIDNTNTVTKVLTKYGPLAITTY